MVNYVGERFADAFFIKKCDQGQKSWRLGINGSIERPLVAQDVGCSRKLIGLVQTVCEKC